MSHGFSRICTDRADRSLTLGFMDSAGLNLKHFELTEKIIGACYGVYNELGHGFLESTCSQAMVVAPEQAGLATNCEVPIPVWFRGKRIGQYFADNERKKIRENPCKSAARVSA